MRGKFDASEVVQQTMLRATSAVGSLRDPQPVVLVAWLRGILASALADMIKHYERDIALERSLECDIDRSASGFASWLAAHQTSPTRRGRRGTC